MTDFGRIRLTYEPGPPDPHSGVLEHSVEMTISGEADLQQLLSFFESFLRANGFVFEGELQIVEREEAFNKQYWQSKYLELMQVAGGEKVEEIVQDRDFWQEQTYKLLRPEE